MQKIFEKSSYPFGYGRGTATNPEPDFCLAVALSPEHLRQDLLRCLPVIEPTTDYLDYRIHHLVQEYARTFRLHKLQRQWFATNSWDHLAEISRLRKAKDSNLNELMLWPPLKSILLEYKDLVRGEDSLVGAEGKRCRSRAKRLTQIHMLKFIGPRQIEI